MQYSSYENCREIEKTHICTVCRESLVTAWDGEADSYVVRCGMDWGHEGFTRVKSVGDLRREGVQLPIEIEQQFQRKEQREMECKEPKEWETLGSGGKKKKETMLKHLERGEKALTALLPEEDAGNSKPLSPEQVMVLIDFADMVGLNAYLRHVDFYFGAPRVTITGRYYYARRQPTFKTMLTRPLTAEERDEQRIEEHVHAWIARVMDKDDHVVAEGFGYSQEKEEGQLMRGVSESWATPQRRAEKRAEEDALGKAYPIGIGIVEEGGSTDDTP